MPKALPKTLDSGKGPLVLAATGWAMAVSRVILTSDREESAPKGAFLLYGVFCTFRSRLGEQLVHVPAVKHYQ